MKNELFKLSLICLLVISGQAFAEEKSPPEHAEKFELKKIEPSNFDKVFPDPPPDLKFPKIKDFDVILEKISPQIEFKAGTAPEITFRMMNLGLKKLVIREWMMKEENNLILYYTPITDEEEVPTFDKWHELKPETGENPKRMPLDLKHRNSVLITTRLPFVKNMKIITPQDFLIIGKLNLSSLPVRSRMIKIRINP